MSIDDKTIMELAGQLGISGDKKRTVEKAKSYQNKSDGELVSEIMQIKEKLKAKNIPYDKQVEMVKSLMPMMNGEQKARLIKIIELLQS